MSNGKKYGLIAAAVAAVFVLGLAWGRFSAPEKIKEKEVIKEVVDQKAIQTAVEKAQIEWKKNEKVKTVERTIYKEGQVVEKIVYVDRDTSEGSSTSIDTTVETKVETKIIKEIVKEKVVEYKRPSYRLGLGAITLLDLDTFDLEPKLQAEGDMRLLGPIWLGARAIPQEKMYGVTLSITF